MCLHTTGNDFDDIAPGSFRVSLLKLSRNDIHRSLRLLLRNAWFEPALQHQKIRSTIIQVIETVSGESLLHHHRNPNIGHVTCEARAGETSRRDSDDGEIKVIELDCLSDEAPVGGEVVLPKAEADDRDRMSARRLIFLG